MPVAEGRSAHASGWGKECPCQWLREGVPMPVAGGRSAHASGRVRQEKDDLDTFSISVPRYRPEELDKLARTTKFTRREIQLIYRGFKQAEMVDVVTAIYEMLGRSTQPLVDDTSAKDHVERIFHLIDTNNDGAITIEELAEWISRDEKIVESLKRMDTVLYTPHDASSGATRPSLSRP
ncbi:hypothetical protein O3P69_019722 [Scylla paramamosain]|uniref:EF-hand domain-containing protein n=1 Tax=Scylla paramamosain TaxID=85552 RepID=A0AAW0SX65_SCYPA